MLIDDSDDDSVLPGDDIASEDEVVEAAAQAMGDPLVSRRLQSAARHLLGLSKQVKRFSQPEDLLQDAIEAVLEGRRKWPKNRVDLKGLLIGVMRSMVSNQDRSLKTKHLDVTMEHELRPQGENLEPPNLEDMAATPETTESLILRKEEDAAKESMMLCLRSQYSAQSLHGLILERVKDGIPSHAEIREALGVADSAYWNAWKALMRAAQRLNQNAKE